MMGMVLSYLGFLIVLNPYEKPLSAATLAIPVTLRMAANTTIFRRQVVYVQIFCFAVTDWIIYWELIAADRMHPCEHDIDLS